MANRVTYTFLLADRFSSIARRIKSSAAGMRDSMRSVAESAKAASQQLKSAGKAAKDFGKKATIVSAAVFGLGLMAVSQAAKFEQMEIAFKTATGSAEKAHAVFENLKQFAAETPFELEGLGDAMKTLLFAGVSIEESQSTLRQLGDVASSTNRDLGDLAFVFSKIKNAGKVTGEEMRQLNAAGLGASVFAQEFKVSGNQLNKIMERGGITFEHFAQVLRKSTSEGGKFFRGMIEQSRTTLGLWSTLKDNFNLASAALGEVIIQQLNLKGVMTYLIGETSEFAKNIKGWAAAHPVLAKLATWFGVLVILIAPLAFAAAGFLSILGLMAAGAALLGTGVTALVGGFIALAAAFAAGYAFGTLLVESFGAIKDAVVGTLKEISAQILRVQDSITGFVTGNVGKALKFLGEVFVSEKSQTDVNVNVNAPRGAVRSVNSVTTGRVAGLNVGVAMREAL